MLSGDHHRYSRYCRDCTAVCGSAVVYSACAPGTVEHLSFRHVLLGYDGRRIPEERVTYTSPHIGTSAGRNSKAIDSGYTGRIWGANWPTHNGWRNSAWRVGGAAGRPGSRGGGSEQMRGQGHERLRRCAGARCSAHHRDATHSPGHLWVAQWYGLSPCSHHPSARSC